MSKKYAMEKEFLARLRADRRDLFGFARAVGSAAEMRAARDELMREATIHRTPKAGETVEYNVIDGVAHIPVVGQLTPSADPCGAFTGQAETEYGFIQAALIAAEDDSRVKEIALDINSPGGYISGLDETAQLLAAVTKPTVAYAGSMVASAAYWLASQADRIVALSPASEIGSIGIAMEEYDDDQALADQGIIRRVYTSTDAPDKRPDTKTEEGQSKVVAELDALHGVFVRRVAEGRNVSADKVKSDFGHGGLLIAESAMAAGMIDEVRGSHIYREQETAIVDSQKAAGPIAHKGVNKMTPEEIAALKAEAIQEGIQAERKRVSDLKAFAGRNAEADKSVEEAIASGKHLNECMAQLVAAVASGSASQAAGDNPPAVVSAVPGTASGANGFDHESYGMSAADVAALRANGMTDDEIRAYAPKGV